MYASDIRSGTINTRKKGSASENLDDLTAYSTQMPASWITVYRCIRNVGTCKQTTDRFNYFSGVKISMLKGVQYTENSPGARMALVDDV